MCVRLSNSFIFIISLTTPMSSFLDVWAPGPIAECIIGYLELEDLLELRSRRRSLLLAVGRHSDAWLRTLLQCPIFAAEHRARSLGRLLALNQALFEASVMNAVEQCYDFDATTILRREWTADCDRAAIEHALARLIPSASSLADSSSSTSSHFIFTSVFQPLSCAFVKAHPVDREASKRLRAEVLQRLAPGSAAAVFLSAVNILIVEGRPSSSAAADDEPHDADTLVARFDRLTGHRLTRHHLTRPPPTPRRDIELVTMSLDSNSNIATSTTTTLRATNPRLRLPPVRLVYVNPAPGHAPVNLRTAHLQAFMTAGPSLRHADLSALTTLREFDLHNFHLTSLVVPTVAPTTIVNLHNGHVSVLDVKGFASLTSLPEAFLCDLTCDSDIDLSALTDVNTVGEYAFERLRARHLALPGLPRYGILQDGFLCKATVDSIDTAGLNAVENVPDLFLWWMCCAGDVDLSAMRPHRIGARFLQGLRARHLALPTCSATTTLGEYAVSYATVSSVDLGGLRSLRQFPQGFMSRFFSRHDFDISVVPWTAVILSPPLLRQTLLFRHLILNLGLAFVAHLFFWFVAFLIPADHVWWIEFTIGANMVMFAGVLIMVLALLLVAELFWRIGYLDRDLVFYLEVVFYFPLLVFVFSKIIWKRSSVPSP